MACIHALRICTSCTHIATCIYIYIYRFYLWMAPSNPSAQTILDMHIHSVNASCISLDIVPLRYTDIIIVVYLSSGYVVLIEINNKRLLKTKTHTSQFVPLNEYAWFSVWYCQPINGIEMTSMKYRAIE